MLEKTAKILLILSILGHGGFSTDTGLVTHLLRDSNADIDHYSTIHRRSAPPIETPQNGTNGGATDQTDKKPEEGKSMNNSNSEVVQMKGKNSTASTEVEAQNTNIPKLTETDIKNLNVSSTMPEITTTENSTTQATTKIIATVKPVEKATDPKEQQTSKTKDSKAEDSTKINDTKTDQSANLQPTDEDKKEATDAKIKQTNNSTTVKTTGTTNVPSTAVDTPKKSNANSSTTETKSTKESNSTAVMEQEDMMHSHVTPHDNDDIITITMANTEHTTEIGKSKNSTLEDYPTTIVLPPVIFPQGKDVKTIDNADPELIAKLNRTIYHTEIGGQTVTGSTSTGTLIKTTDGKNMSSGIIALVTTITFAIAIVFAYIGMVAWRRYLEHKYGRRELLVNELEFDTNDLRHFEL